MRKLHKLALLPAALLATTAISQAATYTTIDNDQSQVKFHYEQMGVKMNGVFGQIGGDIHFDTNNPEEAEVSLTVEMTSVDTGSEEADEEIVKKEWFNAGDHPEATFTTTNINQTADNEFDVTGLLNIKGHEEEIQFPATVDATDSQATFSGDFSLLRGDYAVGEGAWSSFDIVANDIRIEFTIVTTE